MNMISALGIIRDDEPLPPKGPPPVNRLFVASRMVPFAAELVVEKLACSIPDFDQPTASTITFDQPASNEYVRVVLNGGVVPLVFEECSNAELGVSLGLCPLEGFVRAQAFSQSGGNWESVCSPE